jgi:peptide/nickel transport system permease protein
MSATVVHGTSRETRWKKLPLVWQLRQSVGLQRGMLIAGLVICLGFILMAVLAPVIAPYSYNQLSDDSGSFARQAPPGPGHVWGTTVGGFDVLSRVIWGAQTALTTVVIGIAASIFLGVLLGLLSGYLGGWLDRVLVTVADAIYAFPTLLLAIVISIIISGGQSSKWGGIMSAALSITVVFVPQYFRVVRAETVRLKAEPFVESAQVIGTSTARILSRHVLRNATRSLPLIVTLNASEAILTLAGLGFLGFGIVPTAAAEWGYDLNRALADVASGIWWTGIFPGLAIVLLVLGVTLVGESLNDLSDPRLRIRRRVAGTVIATTAAAADLPAEPGEPGDGERRGYGDGPAEGERPATTTEGVRP